MSAPTLPEWLKRLEQLHPSEIELGLERVGLVAQRLGAGRPATTVITVGGTNGKGSCVAICESLLRATGRRAGAYTSPHILAFNERVRIAGEEVADADWIAAFEVVERARDSISLTYFEFTTLAALWLMARADLEFALLEVGLGGRLDAVNIVDADCAIVATVDIDHSDWLGSDRESIGSEKAGIFRPGCPAIYCDGDPPRSLVAAAARTGAKLRLYGRDFTARSRGPVWDWRGRRLGFQSLPRPSLAGSAQVRNAAGVLAALEALGDGVMPDEAAIREGLCGIRLTGRAQVVPGAVEWILDVGHNPQAARELASTLASRAPATRSIAVVGMMGDKDVAGVIGALAAGIDEWIAVGLATERALPASALAERIAGHSVAPVTVASDPHSAIELARQRAKPGDRVVVFGSFHLIGPVMRLLGLYSRA